MAKISQEEYKLLKSLSDYWKWAARTEGGSVFFFKKEPEKGKNSISTLGTWKVIGEMGSIYNFGKTDLFQFIQWEDEDPYNIAELIEEYEDRQRIAQNSTVANLVGYRNESEETEVKTLESIREEIWEEMLRLEDKRKDQWADIRYQTLREVLQKLGHLDEPEVLSQELPVIPKFVADYIEEGKELGSDLGTAMTVLTETLKDIRGYIKNNEELFARAWLDGYTVEEEPLYRARLKVITDEFIASYLRTQSSDAEDRLKALEIGSKYVHEDYRHLSEFTEDELKRLDIWDSEQWEVEELG